MTSKLPTKNDFDPLGGCLDARCAWKHFGGLKLAEAYELFCGSPLHYTEDFMWMGHAALAYYFPVLDKYLREGDDEEQSGMIAASLMLQFGYDDISKIKHLKPQVIDLADFVIQNIDGCDVEEWRKLKSIL